MPRLQMLGGETCDELLALFPKLRQSTSCGDTVPVYGETRCKRGDCCVNSRCVVVMDFRLIDIWMAIRSAQRSHIRQMSRCS